MEIQKSILLFFSGIQNDFLDKIVECITMFGETLIPLAIALFLFWCVDKKKGAISALILNLACTFMHIVKAVVRFPRPWRVIPELNTGRIETATGYSFPSGHSTTASSFYSTIAFTFKKKAISIICAVLILLVPISRLYLCVHWPLDVFCGTLLGFGTSVLFINFTSEFFDNIAKLTKQTVLAGAALVAVGFVMAVLLGAEKIDAEAFTSFSKNISMFGGVLIGFALEEKYYNFTIEGTALQKGLRFIVGIGIAFLLLEGTKPLLPSAPIFGFLRYFISGLWVTIYPLVGRKMKLFN